ncbi:hypothetical protein ACGFZP_09820 [Kitasatospora sp. NPDC048239]|uniref:hypothetical protein n=1 Tax=Kitasatospora sp. NPDC048239 TaxID=3364046 RepID=UPI0037216FFE
MSRMYRLARKAVLSAVVGVSLLVVGSLAAGSAQAETVNEAAAKPQVQLMMDDFHW